MSEVNFVKFKKEGDKIEGKYEGTFKFRLGYALKIDGNYCSVTTVIADALGRVKIKKGDTLLIEYTGTEKRTMVFDVYHNGTMIDRQGEVDLADALKDAEQKLRR